MTRTDPMFERTVSPEDLQRLKEQREEADRRYLEALTALDGVTHSTEYPHAPPPPDDHQLAPLNQLWKLDLQATANGGLKGRVRRVVLRIVGRQFQQQQQFNAAIVDHVNRNMVANRQTQQTVTSLIGLFRDHVASFEHHVILLLQRLTPYIDSKDLEAAGLTRRSAEDSRELLAIHAEHLTDRMNDLVRLEKRIAAIEGHIPSLEGHIARLERLAPVINGLGDEMLKRWEAGLTLDERLQQSVTTLSGRIASLEDTFAVIRQATQTLKRELERVGTSYPMALPASAAVPVGVDPLGLSAVDSYKYVGFENRFRGSEEEIRARQRDYLPFFQGASDVLDVGCGRGEFLELLQEAGIPARGLDINHEMVEVCRAHGLEVHEGDALTYLSTLPDESLGGLIAAQVVEHLEPTYLMRMLEIAFLKLRPGSRIILETINPSCWFAFFESYIRDLTHKKAIHPETLKYLLTANGFQPVELHYRAPYPEHGKLRTVLPPVDGNTSQRALAEVLNENADKVNRLLFGYMDYAAIGSK